MSHKLREKQITKKMKGLAAETTTVRDTELHVAGLLVPSHVCVLCSLLQVCVVAYLGLFMLCVSYQVDERTCVQFSMKVSCFSYFQNQCVERNVTAGKRVLKVLCIWWRHKLPFQMDRTCSRRVLVQT